jgi:hypothetical protein
MLSKRCSVLPCFGPQPKHARMLQAHGTPDTVRWELRLWRWRPDAIVFLARSSHAAAAGMTQTTTTTQCKRQIGTSFD